MELLAAGIDLGTSRIKLHVYNEKGQIVYSESRPSPLHWHRGRAWHDPQTLRQALLEMRKKALDKGARITGVSLYRASISAWKPGGDTLESIVLWLDRALHDEGYEGLPVRARVFSRVPPFSKVVSKYSPLPVIALLHKRYPGSRVWTLDALISEWIGYGYRSEASAAALSGVINPRTLRPIPLIRWLAGLGDLELPEISDSVLHDAPMSIGALLSDQQSALVALPCEGGCVKLTLGTGFFADRRIEGPPPVNTGRGLIPLVLYRDSGRIEYGLESLAPGAGLAVEGLARALGGFEVLHRLGREDCKGWEGSLLLPYPAGPGAGVGASRAVLLGNPSVSGGRELACAIVMGVVGVASHLLWLHGERPGRVYLTGSITSIPVVREMLLRVLPGEVYYCSRDPTPLGAAILASRVLGGELPFMECDSVEAGEGLYREVGRVYDRLVAEFEAGDSAREIGDLLASLIED